ncbi:MAG: PaaI family thioesterase, partial [Anaerobacillus sp.]
AVTSEMTIHYLAKGTGNQLRCRSQVLFKSDTRWVVKANVYRDDQTLIATATGNFMIISRKV